MKKIFIFMTGILAFLFNNTKVVATECTPDTVHQLAKVVFAETGDGSAFAKEDEFFIDIVTAGIVLNNSARFNGDSWSEKIYNLPNGVYYAHDTYRDTPFATFSRYYTSNRRGQVLYASALVLSGKFVLPKYLTGQSSCSCLLGTVPCRDIDGDKNAGANCTTEYVSGNKEWTHFESVSQNSYDMYFGYNENIGLGNTDTFGGRLTSTTPDYYRRLADSFELSDYSKYDTDDVCSLVLGETSSTGNNSTGSSTSSTIIDACTNPDILRVIYFAMLILDIVKIVVPIGLIIMGIIDFSKSVITSDEGAQKKNVSLFVKRIIYAVLVFTVPWIVKVLMINLGNLTEEVNFTDCLENANEDKIKELEEKIESSSNNNNTVTTPKKDTIIYVGDSRTEGMCNSVKMDASEICIYKGGMGYTWLVGDALTDLKSTLSKHPNSYVVINMGTNDLYNTSGKYPDFYNNLADDYPNAQIVVMSVTQIDDELAYRYGYSVRNDDVYKFNNALKDNLSSKIIYCDVYSKIIGNFQTFDGIHYTVETYNLIHSKIKECLN